MFKKTKEKINQNEYIVFIKNMWENKKYRSLLILIMYFIFFFIIITGLRSMYQDSDIDNNSFSFENIKEEYNNLTNYSYEIFVNEESIIVGNLDNSLNNFTYDNENYTIINNVMYKEKDDILEKVDLPNDDLILSNFNKIMLDDLVDYISNLNKSGVINGDSFELDFDVPYTYFSIDKQGYFKVNIFGNTITRVDKVTIDLSEFKEEKYILTVEIGESNDRNIR